jgi:hypothetical protein
MNVEGHVHPEVPPFLGPDGPDGYRIGRGVELDLDLGQVLFISLGDLQGADLDPVLGPGGDLNVAVGVVQGE